MQPESAGLQLQRDHLAGDRLALQAVGHFRAEPPEIRPQRIQVGDVGIEGRLRRHALDHRARLDSAGVAAVRETGEPLADAAVAAHQGALVEPLQVTHRANAVARQGLVQRTARSEEHTSELQSLMRLSYAVFCLKKKKKK